MTILPSGGGGGLLRGGGGGGKSAGGGAETPGAGAAGAGGGAGATAAGSTSVGGAWPQTGAARLPRTMAKDPGISWAGFTVCSRLYYFHPEETVPRGLWRLCRLDDLNHSPSCR